MSDSQHFEELLVRHITFIEKMAVIYCRRDGLSPDETDDFTSWAKERLIENDYAVLRKFRGESTLTTFLTMVLSRLYKDHRVARWGRWRASAEAKRRGPDAVLLETLVFRDGHSLSEAIQLLRARGQTALSDRELIQVYESLGSGVRGRPSFVGSDPLEHSAAPERADDAVDRDEAEAHRARMAAALRRVVDELPPEDAVIVRMRFLEGLSVAQIARVRGVEQKPLYRRLERALLQMRGALEAAGISRQDFLDLFSDYEK